MAGFSIRNELLGKCVQVLVQDGHPGSRVVLGECIPGSALQEWQWLPERLALSSWLTGECLSGQEHDLSVRLHHCDPGNEEGAGAAGGEVGREGQAWACSKKGHLTLQGKGLHLSAPHVSSKSSKVFLSKERRQASKWRTLGNHTVCGNRASHHHHHRHRSTQTAALPSSTSSPSNTNSQPQSSKKNRPIIGSHHPSVAFIIELIHFHHTGIFHFTVSHTLHQSYISSLSRAELH